MKNEMEMNEREIRKKKVSQERKPFKNVKYKITYKQQ